MLRRASTVIERGRGRWPLLAEAALRLVAARASLGLFPFRRIARGLGDFVPCADDQAPLVGDDGADAEAARAVGWAVRAAARRLPFDAACLSQAVAAQAMLRRRGIAASVYLGAGRNGAGAMEAHAWVDAAGIEVTGYPLPLPLRAFGRFARRR